MGKSWNIMENPLFKKEVYSWENSLSIDLMND